MADWGLLAGLGEGLSTLGQGLTERELRRMAEEERKMARQRQAEQDALQKAQVRANAAEGLRKENFSRVGAKDDMEVKKRLLTDLAMQRKQEEYTDPVSGDVYVRGEGKSPTDIAQAQKERDRAMREQLAQIAADNRLAQQQMRDEGAMARRTTQGADNAATNAARAAIEAMRQSGANFRDANGGGGSGTGRDTSLDKREDRILKIAEGLTRPEMDRYGGIIREALPYQDAVARATQMVDAITQPEQQQSVGGGVSGGGENDFAVQAQRAIQQIQSGPGTPAEKAEDIQAVNQWLARKVTAARGGR